MILMTELIEEIKAVKEEKTKLNEMLDVIHETMEVQIKENEVENVAALAAAMKNLVEKYGCQAAAIQCWNALQTEIGIMPCAANAILNEEGIPVVCETDIHGAVTALLVEAAGMEKCAASSRTGRSAIRIWTTENYCSIADHGRYR